MGIKYDPKRQTAQANSQEDENAAPLTGKYEKYILNLLMLEEEGIHSNLVA